MSLCRYAYLRVSLSSFLTASDQGSLMTIGELLNISTLDPLLPTLLIATLCLCILLTILYYSLVIAWEVFWASRWSPSLLDPSAEVVLTCCPSYPFPTYILTVANVDTHRVPPCFQLCFASPLSMILHWNSWHYPTCILLMFSSNTFFVTWSLYAVIQLPSLKLLCSCTWIW